MIEHTFHCDQIPFEVAKGLINNQQAGFYAYRCQSPIPHPHRVCVFADNAWWLISHGEFQIIDNGLIVTPGRQGLWARAHRVEVAKDHPICALLQKDAYRDAGPDIPLPISEIIAAFPADKQIYTRYLGALGLLCECSVEVEEETRESIIAALEDACAHHPLTYRRILNRLEIEVLEETHGTDL